MLSNRNGGAISHRMGIHKQIVKGKWTALFLDCFVLWALPARIGNQLADGGNCLLLLKFASLLSLSALVKRRQHSHMHTLRYTQVIQWQSFPEHTKKHTQQTCTPHGWEKYLLLGCIKILSSIIQQRFRKAINWNSEGSSINGSQINNRLLSAIWHICLKV